jgi:uncharacterized protein (DUF433 family)
MQLEDYFDFVAPNEIRLKGHRVWIEDVLYEYIHNAQSPENMAERFPTLRLDQIYATILYYLQHQEELDQYLANWLAHGERMREQQARHPTPAMLRLQRIRAERQKSHLTIPPEVTSREHHQVSAG